MILRHALRTTAVGVPLFVLIGPVLGRWEALGPAVFAVFALGSFADFGGLPGRRARRYLTAGGVGLLMLPLGTLAGQSTVAVVAVTGVVAFVAFYLGALGGPWFGARFPVLIAYLYAAAAPEPAALSERMAGWATGTVLISLAALVLWPLRPRHTARAQAGEACRRTIDVLQAQADGLPVDDAGLTEIVDELRAGAVAVHLHPGAVAVDERLVSEIVHLVERMVAVVLTAPLRPVGAHSRPVVEASASTLAQVADVLDPAAGRDRPSIGPLATGPRPLGTELEQALTAPAPSSGPGDLGLGVGADLDDAWVRFVANLVLAVATLTDDLVTVLDGQRLPTGPDRDDRPWATLRAHLTFRSLWCRNAVRGAVALMVSIVVIAAGVDDGHGFWVALGTFSVLRADLAAIGRSARSAVVGTAVGFALGSAAVLVGEHQEWVLWLLLPVTMFLASWTGRFRPEVTSAAFTVFLVTMYALADPDGLATAEARLLTVVVGATVTLVVGVVLWPRTGSVPGAALAQVVDAARHRLASAVRTATSWADPGPPPVAGPGSVPGLGVLTELDRVFDTLASSAPAALDGNTRRLLAAGLDVAVLTAEVIAGDPDLPGVPSAAGTATALATDAELARALVGDAGTADAALADLADRLRRGGDRGTEPSPPTGLVDVAGRRATTDRTTSAALAERLRRLTHLASVTPGRTGGR